jgi:hypothetical protein
MTFFTSSIALSSSTCEIGSIDLRLSIGSGFLKSVVENPTLEVVTGDKVASLSRSLNVLGVFDIVLEIGATLVVLEVLLEVMIGRVFEVATNGA